MDKLEYTSDNEEFFDFCHDRYIPEKPFAGKLRSINLLLFCFEYTGCTQPFYDLVYLIRDKIGLKKTVWGIKYIDNSFVYELYFYNSRVGERERTIFLSRLLDIIKPYYRCDIKVDENVPYFMFSIDLFPGFYEQKIEGVHSYIERFSYFLSETGMKLENHYSFYKPDNKNKKEKLAFDLVYSAFVDYSVVKFNEVMLPELTSCKLICRSHKAENDGIYFCGLNIDQFLFFLRKFNYPQPFVSFVEDNREKLDHLQYDVGFDYKMEDSKLKIIKSGYYGTF